MRPATTTHAVRGRVCPVTSGPSSLCGVRPPAGPVPRTRPQTTWGAPPPPRASTRRACTTRGRGWPSSSLPTIPGLFHPPPTVTGGWSQELASVSSSFSPPSPSPQTAATPSVSEEDLDWSSPPVSPQMDLDWSRLRYQSSSLKNIHHLLIRIL